MGWKKPTSASINTSAKWRTTTLSAEAINVAPSIWRRSLSDGCWTISEADVKKL